MEGKKISFGFMKTKKVEKLPVQEKKDFIECVEEKSIKVVGGDEVKEVAPLVIPMKPNTLITSERLQQIAEKVESALEEPEKTEAPLKPENKAPENETLEQMAVRELLEDSKKDIKAHTPQMMMVLPAKSIAGGEKESTLDDYESVPIQDFGLAMLRGMGWTKTDEKSSYKPPQLRPKGLGLGADKVVKDNNKEKANKNSREAELTIVMNAFVKITTGKYSGYYGKVVSLDEDNGRVMVDIPMKKETVSLSEFMMYPVTKSEFDKESKVINANSFEQYKKNEGQKSRNSDKEPSRSKERNRNEKESNSSNENNNRIEKEKQKNKDMKERNQDKSKREKHRDTSEDKHSRKKRDSSNESMSNSDSERNTKKKRKSKKQYSSMESLDSDTERRYKKKDLESDHRRSKKDKERKRHESNSDTDRKSRKSNKECRRQNSDSESERKKKDKEQKRYDSVLESDHRIRKKTEKERSRHVSSSDSDYERSKRSDTPDAKRDIDKKRKGKKKKRDRDRSPHHRRHRK